MCTYVGITDKCMVKKNLDKYGTFQNEETQV